MTLLFPKKKKAALKEISSPAAYVKHIRCDIKLPETAVLCPISSLTKYVENHSQYKKYNCEADIYVLQKPNLCYVTNFGSGAPGMAMALEVLIALGVKKFVFIGLAGSLQEELEPGDMMLCQQALCDDGTSPCYTAKEITQSNKTLLNALAKQLSALGHNYHLGLNWTTDAIFRETPQEVRHYQQKNVLSVEMEIAAFYAICAKRKAQGAAAVVISDVLARLKWEPHFGEKAIFRNLEQLFIAAGKALK
ncbi:nucleoside phosphorylase [Candidatus Avelusimicrobium aviculae]|uniref:nucleoside phosphorylase n=1 Tax=Candidatus Avelusimicrobium aviculae TaxID=3416206 RepID=UPI003D0C05D0